MVEWKISDSLVDYDQAVAEMEARVAGIRDGSAEELVWCLEHPPLYTGGTSAKAQDLLNPQFPVFETGRGGEYTYHGPGQRVAYVMLDLKKHSFQCHPCESRDRVPRVPDSRFRGNDIEGESGTTIQPDLKQYIWSLEEWIIRTLAEFDIAGERRAGRVGIWVATPDGEKKIAAIGVRIRRWVTYHGIAINVNPELSHYDGIVPCGIAEYGVTSLSRLGINMSLEECDKMLQKQWDKVF